MLGDEVVILTGLARRRAGRRLGLVQAARRASSSRSLSDARRDDRTGEGLRRTLRPHRHALVHRHLHQAPGARGRRQPRDRARRLARADDPAGAAVSEDRELVGPDHDGLQRRQRRDRARLPDHADRARRVGDQRRRLHRVDEPRRRQHRHRPPEAEPQQHRGAGRGHRAPPAGPLRAAGGGRAAGRRGAARRPAVRLVLPELHVHRAERAGDHRLAAAHAAAAALDAARACSA